MKILLVHHCDSWGGAGVSLRDICQMLCQTYEVTVCLPRLESEVDKELKKIRGVKTIAIDADMGMISAYNGGPHFISRTYVKNLLNIKNSRRKLIEILNSKKYDMVMLNSITLAWAAKITERMKIPTVIYIRETKVNNPGYYWCKSIIDKCCTGVVYISEFDRRKANLKVKNQAVVKDCLDIRQYNIDMTRTNACNKFGLEADNFNILYVGGSDELKGYSVMLSACKKLSDTKIAFVIAGAVNEEKKINSGNIFYLGKVYNMPALYRACDVLIFPSTKGHQARPIFEAGAMHLPVIISDFPETADEVKNGENGLVFTPGDSDALAACIEKLLSHQDEAQKLGERNYKNTRKTHDFEVCKEKLLNFLTNIQKERFRYEI